MFTLNLIPTEEYNAREIAQKAEIWFNECCGIFSETKESAKVEVENKLEGSDFKGELGVYYTIEIEKVEIDD